jgi:ubiquinone/menaquinone biosynthesis C-methylase UbiE
MKSSGDIDQRGPARRATRPGHYGIDGGNIGVPMFVVVEAALMGVMGWALRRRRPVAASLAGVAGLGVSVVAAGYLYSSGRGKLSTWAEILDELRLSGSEHILDVGCGRGAVLMLAAHRVPAGRAVGADIWRRRDQSGNSRAAAERNAILEGVDERITLVEADARSLPFASESFDILVSSLTFSNIPTEEGREQALSEAVRVLRGDGRLRIVDDRADRYVDTLRRAGCTEVTVRRLDWQTAYGMPGQQQILVSAQKVPPAS